MTPIRRQLENWFGSFTELVYRKKYTAFISALLLTLGLTYQIKDIKFDTRDESFFHTDDPALMAYNAFRDQFGQDDLFIIALKPKNGLSRSFFTTLHDLHRALEAAVPYLDDITSLVNGRVMRADGNTLIVEDLMENPPATDSDIKRLLELIDRYPMYENLLLSTDRSIACILIKARAVLETTGEEFLSGFETDDAPSDSAGPNYLSNAQNVEIAAAIQQIVAEIQDPNIEIYLSGTPAFVADIQMAIQRDLGIMVPLSLLVIIVLLSVLFRRVSGVIYPLVTVVLSLLSCLGIMSLAKVPMTNVFQILPTFLIVVGIGDSVHILTIFYRLHRRDTDKRRAIVQAVSFAGLPVLMTSLTTACGLMSFIWADVASVAQLGWVASIGVMLAFLYTVVMLPALIAIFPVRSTRPGQHSLHQRTDRLFAWIARVTTRYPIRIAVISMVIVGTASIYASSVRLSHSALTWFPEDAPIRIATEKLNRINGGSVMLEITVDTGIENGLHDPQLLTRMDEAADAIAAIDVNGIQAGKVWSIADMLKEINRALHEDKDEAYALPGSRALIAQELILFEASGSDDLEDFTDSTYRIGRLSVLAPFTDAVLYKDYLDQVKKSLEPYFRSDAVTVTGHISLFIQLIRNFITSMVKSYSIALVVITLLMLLMIGRIRIGLMSMVANVVPIACIFGVMGALSIPLDMATILIGSIVLGLVVDDTIHYLHHFRRAYDETGSVEGAVYETLTTTGRALFVTSMVLCGGFLIYTAGYLASNVRFGLLAGSAVLFALAADFFLVPALLSIVYGRRRADHAADF